MVVVMVTVLMVMVTVLVVVVVLMGGNSGGDVIDVGGDGGDRGHGGGCRQLHLLLAHDEERDVVGQDGEHVDDVHGALDEFPLLG